MFHLPPDPTYQICMYHKQEPRGQPFLVLVQKVITEQR